MGQQGGEEKLFAADPKIGTDLSVSLLLIVRVNGSSIEA